MSTQDAYPRHALAAVDEALADTPVVVLQGARQVGKSTLAGMLAKRRGEAVTTVTLDDPGTLDIARADPTYFVNQAEDGLLIVDEAQRAPELILPLKSSVDRNRHPGRYLLIGSADLLQVKGVGDSLAGRAETIELMPLSQGEIVRRDTPENFTDWLIAGAIGSSFDRLEPEAVITGGYPEAIRRTPERASRWYSSYIERLADHDARELQRGGYADHLQLLLALVAAGGQAELVKAKYARELGASETTVDTYIRLATTMRLLVSLPSWGRAIRGRLNRKPKISLNDTGLSGHLSRFGIDHVKTLGGREYFGSLVEQFVAAELHKQRAWSRQLFDLYHYRDRDGLEVDIVVELADGRLIAMEVKSTQSVTAKAWSGLERFRERFSDRQVTGVVLHGGSQVAHLHGWLHVLPIPALWMH